MFRSLFMHVMGTHRRNLHQSSVITTRVTYFIPQAYTRTCASRTLRNENKNKIYQGQVREKSSWMDLEVRNQKGRVPGRGWSMRGYIMTYSRLRRVFNSSPLSNIVSAACVCGSAINERKKKNARVISCVIVMYFSTNTNHHHYYSFGQLVHLDYSRE